MPKKLMTAIKELKYPQFTHKDFFELFVGDNCEACNGIVEQAERFAVENKMSYKVYHNSKEIPSIPAARFCEFIIIGNRLFEKLRWIVKAKRERII